MDSNAWAASALLSNSRSSPAKTNAEDKKPKLEYGFYLTLDFYSPCCTNQRHSKPQQTTATSYCVTQSSWSILEFRSKLGNYIYAVDWEHV